jgi:predicted transcriptional regulator
MPTHRMPKLSIPEEHYARELRDQAWSQERIAEYFHVSQATISRLLRGYGPRQRKVRRETRAES